MEFLHRLESDDPRTLALAPGNQAGLLNLTERRTERFPGHSILGREFRLGRKEGAHLPLPFGDPGL